MNEKQRKNVESVKSVTEGWQKLQRLTGSEGNYAYRGQENAEWGVESGASRRLNLTNIGRPQDDQERFIRYHETELLDPARMDGYGVEEGRPLSDLELLAKLQHHGAATCLIDFTRNFLVAMWFACQSHKEKGKEKNGKIFILNTSDEKNFLYLGEKKLEEGVKSLLTFEETKSFSPPKSSWWHWSPHGLEKRILKQDSLFIFAHPKIENTLLEEIEIREEYKDKILKELERLGITERTLFKDLPGFAATHHHNKPLPKGYETAEYYLQKGNEALQRDDHNDAIEYYSLVITFEKELERDFVAEAYYNRGKAKSALDNYDGAIADYEKAIELKPDYAKEPDLAEAYYNRGTTKSNLSDHRGAMADYDRAIELDPDYAVAYNNRGKVKSALNDYDGAIADRDKAIELNSDYAGEPDYAEAYHKRGNAKSVLRNHRGAIEDYEKAIELKPDHVEAYNSRGLAKFALKNYEGAMADYDRAIELERDYAVAYNNRGLAKVANGDHKGAIADYDRAIELERDYAAAYNNRGLPNGRLDRHSDAIAASYAWVSERMKSAIMWLPGSDRVIERLNPAIRRLPGGAIADYVRAIKLRPDYAKAYYNRGLAYTSLKEKGKARRDLSKAQKLAKRSGDNKLLNLIDKKLSELDNKNKNK